MNTQNLVSIIMPMYNAAAFVAQAIESVLAQRYSEWELLIIDDGSTDASASIAETYVGKDVRIRLFRNPHPVKMPSAPRNMGLSMQKADTSHFSTATTCGFPRNSHNRFPCCTTRKWPSSIPTMRR